MYFKGAFNNYMDRTLPFLTLPLRGQFSYPKRGQKQTFFDPSSPYLDHVVIECPLKYECFSIALSLERNSWVTKKI